MINQIPRSTFVAAIEAGIAAADCGDPEAAALRRFGREATCSAYGSFEADGYKCPVRAVDATLDWRARYAFTRAFDSAIIHALPLDYTFNNLVEVTDV